MDGLVPGRIVLYVLSGQDCREINRRRTTGQSIADRMKQEATNNVTAWPAGAQAHIGIDVEEGNTLPAQVISVSDQETGCCNLKVNLDGTDQFWARDRYYTADARAGTWFWPPRA